MFHSLRSLFPFRRTHALLRGSLSNYPSEGRVVWDNRGKKQVPRTWDGVNNGLWVEVKGLKEWMKSGGRWKRNEEFFFRARFLRDA